VSPDVGIGDRPEMVTANEDGQLNKAIEISQGR
jgi:hypothetical protein